MTHQREINDGKSMFFFSYFESFSVSGELATVVERCKSLTCMGCVQISEKDESEELRAKVAEVSQKLVLAEQNLALLAAYPDLATNVTTFYHDKLLLSDSGDIGDQMRKQIEANNMRLDIIQKENQRLMNALGESGFFY